MSNSQDEAIKNIKKKMQNDNLCIYETDKTGKFVMDSVENMKKKMKVHIENDKVINHKEVTKIENKLNNETRTWVKMMNISEKFKQKQRTMTNLVTTKNPIPILRGTAKDHKKPKNLNLGHDLRPIMSARVGPNTSLSQIGSRILRKIAENVKEDNAIKSTEELL